MPVQNPRLLTAPAAGILILVVAHFVYVVILEFTGLDPTLFGDQYLMALSVKAAWLAIAQLPLLLLHAGKYSFISLLTGVTWERLNVLHRWTARVLLLLVIIHYGAESLAWGQFGLTQLEWTIDSRPTTGLISFILLLWLNISTLAPIRNFSYEFFRRPALTFFLRLHLCPADPLASHRSLFSPLGPNAHHHVHH
jgi:ferric-chelate reductase